MKIEKVLLSVLLATTAGVALGLLIAPEKGSRTRRKIREKGEDYLEDLKDDYDQSIRNFKHKIGATYLDIASKLPTRQKSTEASNSAEIKS